MSDPLGAAFDKNTLVGVLGTSGTAAAAKSAEVAALSMNDLVTILVGGTTFIYMLVKIWNEIKEGKIKDATLSIKNKKLNRRSSDPISESSENEQP